MPKRKTYKRRTSRRRRTVRGGWRLWPWGSAKVAPMPAAPSLRPRKTVMNYVLGRQPPINFSRLSNAEFDTITGAQLDTMSEQELEAYTARLQSRTNQTHREIAGHLQGVKAARNAFGRQLGRKPSVTDEEELDALFAEAEAEAAQRK